MGGATIQFNCVSAEEMRDAQAHPERHRDLQVRICGLSAYFVALERGVQDEMIKRAMMGA
jgi:formate C-acetyltransferase